MTAPGIRRVGLGLAALGRPGYITLAHRGSRWSSSGEPITTYCRQAQASPAEVLRLFETVCDAVGHAHDAGVIHRDIKPSNDAPVPVVRLAAITSGSVPAVKDVLRGEGLYRLGDFGAASAAYQAALEKDSSFALTRRPERGA